MTGYTIFVCVLCFTFSFVGVTAQRESCVTPRNKRGSCIPIRSCDVLYQLVQQRPVSQENVDYLRESQCGFDGNNPKVCCPEEKSGQSEGGNGNVLPGTDDCGLDKSKRIIGGVTTSLKEFPWMALLEYDKPTGKGFHCGGSLITSRYVITAAHCIKRTPKSWKLISVRLGEHTLDTDPDCFDSKPGFEDCADPPINVAIEEVIVHEQYIPKAAGQGHDIALLRLSRPVTYTEFISPVCLPADSHPAISYGGNNMTVSGWGRTETRGQSNTKMKLEVPVKPNSECASLYSSKANVNLIDGQVCAGGLKGQDSCTGDSGGPLMYLNTRDSEWNWYLAGIVSFGPTPCAMKDWPGVYTKVVNYRPWILQNMKP